MCLSGVVLCLVFFDVILFKILILSFHWCTFAISCFKKIYHNTYFLFMILYKFKHIWVTGTVAIQFIFFSLPCEILNIVHRNPYIYIYDTPILKMDCELLKYELRETFESKWNRSGKHRFLNCRRQCPWGRECLNCLPGAVNNGSGECRDVVSVKMR